MKSFFCAIWNHIEYFFILLLFGGVFYLAITQGSYVQPDHNKQTEYANKIFDKSYVHKIEVEIPEGNLEDLLAEPREKNKYHVLTKIDGEEFNDVAFSVRGNGSVLNVMNNEYSNRYSYTINFKKFNSRLSYYGLDKLVLNNLYFEPSYLRSALALNIASYANIDSSLYSFTELYINGNLQGLYLALEAVDRSFLDRIGASRDATLFHPSPYDADWDRVYEDSRYLPEGESIDPIEHRDSSRNTYGGSDLVYRGDAPVNYNAIFMNATTKHSRADETFIIKGIESLSEVSLQDPEDYWDLDAVINFFTFYALAPNNDSYLSSLAQNYYLKISDGKMSLIPWDFDRAFMIDGYRFNSLTEDAIMYWPIDSPTYNITDEELPLWRVVLENPNYLQRYHDAIQKSLDRYFFNGECRREFDKLVELIRPYVYADPARNHSTEQFEEEVTYLRNFILLRADSVQRQLWGIEPSTKEEE